jgi:hypothetical protein
VTGDQLLQLLTNDYVTVQAKGGKVLLSPRSSVKPHHRDLVRKHKAELLRALGHWPDGTAPANAYLRTHHINRTEQGAHDRPRPMVNRRR